MFIHHACRGLFALRIHELPHDVSLARSKWRERAPRGTTVNFLRGAMISTGKITDCHAFFVMRMSAVALLWFLRLRNEKDNKQNRPIFFPVHVCVV